MLHHSSSIRRLLQLAAVGTVALVSGCHSMQSMPYHTSGRSAIPSFDRVTYPALPTPAIASTDAVAPSQTWTALDDDVGPGQLTPDQINDNEIVRRREKEVQADELYIEARAAFAQKDYQTAVQKIERAQLLLMEASRSEARIRSKVDALENVLAGVYMKWADSLARQAKRTNDVDTYERAIHKYQRAGELMPTSDDSIRRDINRLNKVKKHARFVADVYDGIGY
jgi:tetratricopeptide (TPR) repeat protein